MIDFILEHLGWFMAIAVMVIVVAVLYFISTADISQLKIFLNKKIADITVTDAFVVVLVAVIFGNIFAGKGRV